MAPLPRPEDRHNLIGLALGRDKLTMQPLPVSHVARHTDHRVTDRPGELSV